jgi:hypothetical protein
MIRESNMTLSWHLGTCIPRAVVDYLSNKQAQLASLSITTDITCTKMGSNIHCLSRFSQLQHFSLEAYNAAYHAAEINSLGPLIWLNAVHVQNIKIECGCPHYRSPDGVNPFVKYVLRKEPGSRYKLFPALRKLTLFSVYLDNGVEDIVSAFSIPQLRSLKLQDCFGTNHMLDFLATHSEEVHLTSFELNFSGYVLDQYEMSPLVKFLQSFQGLEDLFMLYPRQWTLGAEYWSSVSHHRSTLRRLVHQQADFYHGSENNDSIIGQTEILTELEKIQYLGTGCPPDDLVS